MKIPRLRTRKIIALAFTALVMAGCGGSAKPEEPSPAEPAVRPLAQLAAQRVILTPAFSVRAGDPMGWAAGIPRARDYLKLLDDELARELGDRGLKTQWYYPADLVRAARSNPTYAADPYALGVNVLRDPNIVSGTRFGDPLATQLRTMVALHETARAVLVPVELRFERSGANAGVAVLRVVMVDGRLADVRWVGTVRSDPSPALTDTVLRTLATRFADLIAAP